jgi:hypothetical protein
MALLLESLLLLLLTFLIGLGVAYLIWGKRDA